ncbi:hypothetical protein K2X05_03875, partial [bacterium]|nr:hypothetical protein [bacterium]
MIYLIISILISSFVSAEEPAFQKNILKDNWQVGGGASYYSDDDSNYSFSISPSVQYFFWDHISLGPILSYSNSRYGDSFSLGAIGSYYFLEEGPFVWSISQAISYRYSKTDVGLYSDTYKDVYGSSSLNL